MGMGVLHLGNIRLSGLKPIKPLHLGSLETISDHIKAVRVHRRLFQREVAEILGVSTTTVEYWEKKRNEPSIQLIPKITEFLGYCIIKKHPMGGWRQSLLNDRWQRGFRQSKFAKIVGVDQKTLIAVEKGRKVGSSAEIKILRFLEKSRVERNDVLSAPPCLFGS